MRNQKLTFTLVVPGYREVRSLENLSSLLNLTVVRWRTSPVRGGLFRRDRVAVDVVVTGSKAHVDRFESTILKCMEN